MSALSIWRRTSSRRAPTCAWSSAAAAATPATTSSITASCKVIAINSDIEAAAKAGYFTQLTFNEDLNILSVTNLCPYTYDFVYNERQAYKECYVLNNVL